MPKVVANSTPIIIRRKAFFILPKIRGGCVNV